MKHCITSVVAALAAVLTIPGISAEQMRIEKKIVQPMFFDADIRIRDAVHRFIGDDEVQCRQNIARPDSTDRPRRFIKTAQTEFIEDWKCTSWWVEEGLERDDILSDGTNVCDFCRSILGVKSFMKPFWSFKSYPPRAHSDDPHKNFRIQQHRCGTVIRTVPLRYARIRSGMVTETYTDSRSGDVVFKARRSKIDVLNVVSEDDFYRCFLEAEKERKAKFDGWVEELNSAER